MYSPEAKCKVILRFKPTWEANQHRCVLAVANLFQSLSRVCVPQLPKLPAGRSCKIWQLGRGDVFARTDLDRHMHYSLISARKFPQVARGVLHIGFHHDQLLKTQCSWGKPVCNKQSPSHANIMAHKSNKNYIYIYITRHHASQSRFFDMSHVLVSVVLGYKAAV